MSGLRAGDIVMSSLISEPMVVVRVYKAVGERYSLVECVNTKTKATRVFADTQISKLAGTI